MKLVPKDQLVELDSTDHKGNPEKEVYLDYQDQQDLLDHED